MTVFENIHDVPLDKHTGARRGKGINSGRAKIRCVINERCPFMLSPRFEDSLVFNHETIDSFPPSVKDNLSSYPGHDGIFLKPNYNYRHTYIASIANGTEKHLSIENPHRNEIESAPYREEQTFYVNSSFFEDSAPEVDTTSPFCDSGARWTYLYPDNTGFYPDSDDSRTVVDKIPVVLNPMMVGSSACGDSVHWSLGKKTNMFRGEDFFVSFNNMQRSVDLGVNTQATPPSFGNNITGNVYRALDATNPPTDSFLVPGYGQTPMPINYGVGGYTLEMREPNGDGNDPLNWHYKPNNKKTFLLTDQPYYMIDLGLGMDPDHHYVIIITQRANPAVVQLKHYGSTTVCLPIASMSLRTQGGKNTGASISGGSLLNADWFTMSVRNHLGSLAIQFFGPNFESEVWMVKRFDREVNNYGQGVDRAVPMVVPEAPIRIFGGHRQCNLLFGPIQYLSENTNGVKIIMPASATSPPGAGPSGPLGEDFYTLPIDASSYDVVLSSTDSFLEESAGTSQVYEMFTQEAQRFFDTRSPSGIIGRFMTMQNTLKGSSGTPGELKSYLQTYFIDLNDTDDSGRNVKFRVGLEMFAGDHIFTHSDTGAQWILENCKTPVATMVRMLAEENQTDRFTPANIEVSNNVMSYNDSWTSDDYVRMQHTGRIKFLLNDARFMNNNQAQYIESLKDKAFYITVWGGYDDPDPCNYAQLPHMFRLFTGVCYGGEITIEYGLKTMDCSIYDYSKILEDQRIFNSPFFDGIIDVHAVSTLLDMAGFKNAVPEDPGYLVKQLTTVVTNNVILTTGLDNRLSYYCKYALPAGYQRLTQPKFRAEDGSQYLDLITRIAKQSGKVFFFDAYGVAHFEDYKDQVASIISGGTTVVPIFHYTNDPKGDGSLVHSSVTVNRSVVDVHNHIKLISNTPDFTPLFFDDVNYPSIEDPTATGFLGYMRTFYQVEPFFGSAAAALNAISFYRAFFIPPTIVRLQSYGQPVRALDIIGYQDVRTSTTHQPLRITNVDNEFSISDSTQSWMQTLDCEWFHPLPI